MPQACSRFSLTRPRLGFTAGLTLIGTLLAASAYGQVIFNNIPSPLPGNVASAGPEAYSYVELGDGLTFAPGPRTVYKIKVIMSDWACVSGHWTGSPSICVTPPGSTFQQAITMNIYSVTGTTPGPLINTQTQTFTIPYRPSSTPALCAGDNTRWFDAADATCYHGLAFPIEFDFNGLTLPNSVIVTLAFNTSTAGPAPLGTGNPCNSTPQGCPYDSLNVSAQDGVPAVGTNVDPNGIFVNFLHLGAGLNCAASTTGHLEDDTPCHTNDHPEMLVDTTPPDFFQVSYAANLGSGDSVVNLTNAGSIDGLDPAGDICANVYVFDPGQELIECCACNLTPNHLKSLSVVNDLTANTLTPGKPAAVSLVLVASPGPTCNPTTVAVFSPGLRAWSTTIHANPTGGFNVTEKPFLFATPSASELAKLTNYCTLIHGIGSGYGLCKSCSTGPLGATGR